MLIDAKDRTASEKSYIKSRNKITRGLIVSEDAIRTVSENWNREWGIYPNLGIGEPSPDGVVDDIHSDENFINLIEKAVSMGATILGACCGSDIRHIKLISRKFTG